MSINGVNFIIVHIISQAVLERRNYTVTQKEPEPNFKPEYLVTHPELSIGFIPMERSFLCPSIELFWNSLITYAKKNYSFYSLVKMECCWYLKICKIVWFNWNIFAMRQTGQMTILKPCKASSCRETPWFYHTDTSTVSQCDWNWWLIGNCESHFR